jgi:hypothetical protein
MNKYSILIFLVNLLSFLSVYSSDTNLEIREQIIFFQKHPYIYSNTVTGQMCLIDKCLTTENSDPTDFIDNLSQLLSDYIYMISHQNNLEPGNEIIELLEGEISKLNATQELITELKEQDEFFEQDQERITSMACLKIMQILKRPDLKKIFRKAHKILATSYNQKNGKPWTYREIFLKVTSSSGISEEKDIGGVVFFVPATDLKDFLLQFVKSQDAGFIHLTEIDLELEDEPGCIRRHFMIAESSKEGAKSFKILFNLKAIKTTP